MRLMYVNCDRCGKTSDREVQDVSNADNQIVFTMPPCPNCAELEMALRHMVEELGSSVKHLEAYNALLHRHPDWGGNGGVQASGEMQKRMKRSLEWLKFRIREGNFADVLPSTDKEGAAANTNEQKLTSEKERGWLRQEICVNDLCLITESSLLD